jgi:undecaprenyl-diphosphatase
MQIVQAIILACVQGLTEFLPVSSSAHLILVSQWLHWPDQGLAFDVAVHVGTVVAVLFYFRASWRKFLTIKHLMYIGIATLPVGLVGLFGKHGIETHLRSAEVIAMATLGFGVLLGISDRWGSKQRTFSHFALKDALWMGFAQAFALIPGTSRSGITLTAGLAAGLTRTTAAQFSFLLSIPVIVLAGGLEMVTLHQQAIAVDWGLFCVGVFVAGMVGYACIHVFLRCLERWGVWPFVMYRVFLGLYLLSSLR